MAPQAVLARSAPKAATRSALFPLVPLMLAALLTPATFDLGGLLMTPLRLFCLVMVPWLGFRWIRGDFGRLVVPDYAMMVFLFWMTLAMAYHHPDAVITFAGSNVALIFGGYLVGRAAIRTVADFQRMAWLMALAAIVLLPFGAAEALLNIDSPILGFYSSLPGFGSYPDSDYCCRLGLNRAQTAFIHPIHYGIFCSLSFSVFFFGLANRRGLALRVLVSGLAALSAFMSVSSGAVLVIGLQGMLILYALAFHSQPWQWKLATRAALASYLVLELATTKAAFISIAGKLAFSSQNVWLREVILEKGMTQIAKTPLLGIGANRLPGLPYWMSGSLDNFWLATAVMYGMPTMLACLTIFVWPMFRAGGGRLRKGSDLYHARVSWTFLLIGLTLSLATVYIWESVQTAIYFMVGAGMFLFYAQEPGEDGEDEEAPKGRGARRKRLPYSRAGQARPLRSRARPRYSPPRPAG
ncbi:hypothetical protein [Poseidonocella sp. HB161398]|uniref:hypothetical protein n=1 Tax=Poseidonocella sp. HB161398 TaxID=2320855 RepID=UPI001107F1F5|nr:hypothetical protein [Poseidonocella sp. HB161398]